MRGWTRWARRGHGRIVTTGRVGVTLLSLTLVAAACSTEDVVATRSADAATTEPSTTMPTTSTTTTTAPPTTVPTTMATTTASTTTAPPTTAATTTAPTSPAPLPAVTDRDHVLTGYAPYATAGSLTLRHPAAIVEVIGLHESNHEGAQDQSVVEGTTWAMELETRGRLAGPRSSADIVTQPDVEIRAPVTGVVSRASRYTLYCDFQDEYLVINPDENPAFEVKVLHVQGLAVAPGDRVVAGETVVAARAHKLPFDSQVDKHTAEPSWPHVHLEVIDPSVPNVPNGGTGSEDC